MYLSIESGAQPPYFKECAKHPVIEEAGFVLYYTDQCPYTYYWVPKVQEAAKEHGIPFNAISYNPQTPDKPGRFRLFQGTVMKSACAAFQ